MRCDNFRHLSGISWPRKSASRDRCFLRISCQGGLDFWFGWPGPLQIKDKQALQALCQCALPCRPNHLVVAPSRKREAPEIIVSARQLVEKPATRGLDRMLSASESGTEKGTPDRASVKITQILKGSETNSHKEHLLRSLSSQRKCETEKIFLDIPSRSQKKRPKSAVAKSANSICMANF